jgi:lipoprotein
MKKVIVSLFLLVPLLTGCTNIDTQVTINDDRSASVATSLTYEGNLSDSSDIVALTIADNYAKFLDPLYTSQEAYGKKLSTITASKSVKDLKYDDLDLSSLGFTSNLPSGKFIEVKKSFLVSSFNIDATYNLKNQIKKVKKAEKTKQIKRAEGLDPVYLKEYGDPSEYDVDDSAKEDIFAQNLDDSTKEFVNKNLQQNEENKKEPSIKDLKASFSVKVPTFASSNNADSVSGNVYTWDISQDGPTVIKLQYVQYSGFAIAFVILVGILVLVLLARKILKHDTQKRIDN